MPASAHRIPTGGEIKAAEQALSLPQAWLFAAIFLLDVDIRLKGCQMNITWPAAVLLHLQQTQSPPLQAACMAISASVRSSLRYLTEAQAGTGQTCRSPPASGAQCAGWQGAGHGGCGRRSGSSHRHRSHPPSSCGRHR